MKQNEMLSIKNKNGLDFYFSGKLSNEEMQRLKENTESFSLIDMEDKSCFKPYEKDFIISYKDNQNSFLYDNRIKFNLFEILNIQSAQMNEQKVVDFMIDCNEKTAFIVNENGYLFDLIYNEDIDFGLLEKKGCFIFDNREKAVQKVVEILQKSQEEIEEIENGEDIFMRKLNNHWIEYNERYAEDPHDEDFESKNIVDKISDYVI